MSATITPRPHLVHLHHQTYPRTHRTHDLHLQALHTRVPAVSSAELNSAVFRKIFELAVDDGTIKTNPAINLRTTKGSKPEIKYFSKEEVNKILAVAKGTLKAYLMIAFNTGMRPEEILGLAPGDIDESHINIRRVRSRGKVMEPKTKSSIRSMPYPRLLSGVFESLKGDSTFLFGDIDDSTKLRSEWKDAIKAADVKYRSMYTARHTYATLMLREKIVSLNELAGLLGHASAKVTLTHYASVIDSGKIQLEEDFDLFGTNLAQ